MAICKKIYNNVDVTLTVTNNPVTGEPVKPFEVVVTRYNIITTETYIHEVWVKEAEITYTGPYSSLQTFGDTLCGGYCSYFDYKEFQHLKLYSDERTAAVRAFFDKRYNEAYALIAQVFPYVTTSAEMYKSDGKIDMQADDIIRADPAQRI